MAKSQSLVAVRNCDDSVFLLFIEHKKNKQLQLKTYYNNKIRYSFDINNIQRSSKTKNIKPGEIYIHFNKFYLRKKKNNSFPHSRNDKCPNPFVLRHDCGFIRNRPLYPHSLFPTLVHSKSSLGGVNEND